MKKNNILNFFLLLCITYNVAFAQLFSTESTSDYYRLKFFTDNGLLKVSKINNIIYLKTLNNDIFNKLNKELGSLDKNKKVVKVEKIMPREGNNVFQINIHLNKDVEVFSFGAIIRDVWIGKHMAPVYFGRSVSKAKAKIVD